MADYKKMYAALFNRVTDVIGELQEIQRATEEMYIHSREPQLKVLRPGENHPDESRAGGPGAGRPGRKA